MAGLLGDTLLRYAHYLYAHTVTDRLEAQLDFLRGEHCCAYVDCGCGGGVNTYRLAERIGPEQTLGIELSTALLQEAQARRSIIGVRADLNEGIPLQSGSVDVMTAMDIIEHLVEVDRFVSELHRVLSPGGCAVLATPNLASWHNVFALIIGVQPFSGPNITSMEDADLGFVHRMHRQVYDLPEDGDSQDESDKQVRRHVVVMAYESLIRLFQRKGLIVERVLGFGYYPFPPFIARLLSRIDKRHSHHLVMRVRKPVSAV